MTDDIRQNTPEWRQARCGSVGASQIADITARTRNGYGASRANLMAQVIVERLTGIPQDTYTSAAMQFGIENEPLARTAYAATTFETVTEIGIVRHPTITGTHASPDGMVGTEGLVELKVPNSATHIDTLLGASIPDKYLSQCSWQMACTGRKWCDLVSFDPRFPTDMQLHVTRIPRDDKLIKALEDEVRLFLKEVDERMSKLTARYRKDAA